MLGTQMPSLRLVLGLDEYSVWRFGLDGLFATAYYKLWRHAHAICMRRQRGLKWPP